MAFTVAYVRRDAGLDSTAIYVNVICEVPFTAIKPSTFGAAILIAAMRMNSHPRTTLTS
jgi:hypothetical protein